jgi:hypothetical protein
VAVVAPTHPFAGEPVAEESLVNRSWNPALCLIAACGALSLLATPAAAEEPWTLLSPWTLNRSGYFVQGTFSYLSTGSYYDAVGEKQDNPYGDYRDITVGAHLEYGVRDHLGLVLHLPVRSLTQQYADTPDLTTTGIGDITGGLRYRILDGPVVASAQGEIKLSSGYNAAATTPPLGEGQTDYTIRALAGKAFAPKPIFAQAAIGYCGRTKDPASEFLFNADAGVWPVQKLLVTGQWEWVKHTGDGDVKDFFKGGLGARYRAWKAVDIALGAFQTFGGIDVPAGTQFYLGLSYKGNRLGKYDGLLSSSMDASGAPVPAKQPGAEAAPAPTGETPAEPAPTPAPTPPPTPTPGNP